MKKIIYPHALLKQLENAIGLESVFSSENVDLDEFYCIESENDSQKTILLREFIKKSEELKKIKSELLS